MGDIVAMSLPFLPFAALFALYTLWRLEPEEIRELLRNRPKEDQL